MKRIISIILCAASGLLGSQVLAQVSHQNSLGFDIDQAKSEVKRINKKLSMSITQDEELYFAVQRLKHIQEEAASCVEKGQKQLKTIDRLLEDIGPRADVKELRIDAQYLDEKKAGYVKSTAECRLLVFKTEETLSAYKDTIGQLNLSRKLKKTMPIWHISFDSSLYQFNFDGTTFLESSGINSLDSNDILGLFSVLVIMVILGWYLRKWLNYFLNTRSDLPKAFKFLITVARSYLPSLMLFYILSFFAQYALGMPSKGILLSLGYTMAHYLLLLSVGHYLLLLPADRSDQEHYRLGLFKRYQIILSLIYVGVIVTLMLREQVISSELSELARIVYVTILCAVVYRFSWTLIQESHKLKKINAVTNTSLKGALTLVFLSILAFEWIGYHHLSMFLVYGVFLTALLGIVTIIVLGVIEKWLSPSENNKLHLVLKLRTISGIKPHKRFHELFVLKLSVQAIVVLMAAAVLLKAWGASLNYIDFLSEAITNGFMLFDITIYPLRIIYGLFALSIVLISGRILATNIAQHTHFEGEESRQVTIASIVNYLSFFVALIIALVVAGVNFTSLAIIVGALSVGIGFGLQNIVNNFISGMILLIQRPIKPGDRIVVGNVEGFVRKIRVLSTQINTLAKEDVLIPNANLIYEPVTNFMFRDKLYRVVCRVGVVYGSDVDLVKQVLLEVAADHPGIIHEHPNQPFVLFKAFADSSLNFELYSVIWDVNKKFLVASELHFAINKAFEQHGIVIAFPQQDIHIRDYVNLSNQSS